MDYIFIALSAVFGGTFAFLAAKVSILEKRIGQLEDK